MVRAFVVYEGDIDESRYAEHVELCERVPGATFRHGRVFGAPTGESRFTYYAEWEFADMETFREAGRSAEFMETGKDAMQMGVPFSVHFAELTG